MGQASFSILSPRYLERYSLCGHLTLLMTWIIVHFMDLGIYQQDLPLAESIHGDKVPAQKVSTYLSTLVSWYQQQHWHGHI